MTNAVLMEYIIELEEVVDMALFLCSPRAIFVTGVFGWLMEALVHQLGLDAYQSIIENSFLKYDIRIYIYLFEDLAL